MKGLTLRQLRTFAEVARHLSFVRAAEALHLTPPAVTMQVKELETLLGLQLLVRRGRQVSLTTAGEYLTFHVRRILATVKDAEDAMARFRGADSGLLSIGLVGTAKYFVPQLLARFREAHPGVELRMRIGGNREQLVAMLAANEIDLAIMGRPPRELATRSEPFAAHPLVFIAGAGHPLATSGEPVTPRALAHWPCLAREPGSGTRKVMEDYFEARRIEPHLAMEMPSNEIIKQAVIAGMGISFLSLHTLGLELRTGLLRILDVEGTPVVRTWNLVHRLSKVLSPAAEAFRYFMLSEAEPFLRAQDEALLGAPAIAHARDDAD